MAIKFSVDLISLREVPNHVPKVNGKKAAMSSVYRWANTGLSGVKLETVAGPSGSYTSHEAIAAFFDAVNRARKGETQSQATPAKTSDKAHSAAMKQLDAAGV